MTINVPKVTASTLCNTPTLENGDNWQNLSLSPQSQAFFKPPVHKSSASFSFAKSFPLRKEREKLQLSQVYVQHYSHPPPPTSQEVVCQGRAELLTNVENCDKRNSRITTRDKMINLTRMRMILYTVHTPCSEMIVLFLAAGIVRLSAPFAYLGGLAGWVGAPWTWVQWFCSCVSEMPKEYSSML